MRLPPKVIPGQSVTAASYNALIDAVQANTVCRGIGVRLFRSPGGTTIEVPPAAAPATPLFPFAVRLAGESLQIYWPGVVLTEGLIAYAPENAIETDGDWRQIEGLTLPTESPATLYAVVGRELLQGLDESIPSLRLLFRAPDGTFAGAPESFAPRLMIPIARVAPTPKEAEGGEKIVYSITQLIFSALTLPEYEPRPWTFDAAQKSWLNAWCQINRRVFSFSSAAAENKSLLDGYYYVKADHTTGATSLERMDTSEAVSTADVSFFYVGRILDGRADEAACPHHIPVIIVYE